MNSDTVRMGTIPAAAERRVISKVAAAGFIGNFVEWFDYASYAYLATVIAAVFFPDVSPAAGLMATFGVFALSFIIRPIGGVFWGHYGDKIGRKQALSLSIIIMSGATFAIALLPDFQQIGVWAPLLLLGLRLIQGFSASGEYAGASAFLVEYAPSHKRGLYASIVPASTASGLLLGSLMVAGMHVLLTPEQLQSWGWRLPFLLAAPLGYIGRYIRVHLEDSPKFREMEASREVSHAPVSLLLSQHRRALLISIGVTMLNAVGFYIILSYMPTYLAVELGVGETDSFIATTIALVAYIGFIFLMGVLSDRLGRKTMLILASVAFICLTVPLFSGLASAGFLGIILIQVAFGALLTMNDGTLPCFLSEIFPTRVRYSGFALSFNLANAIFGGTAPFIATWLIQATGDKLAPAWYLVVAAGIALVAMIMSRETSGEPLQD
ncbi:MAG: MFS transporter [Castellaniella sp.]|uniref:MFS transporter n=1 Tax=Castellaniella hirudinis TaxID=1144617 RepID=A0ABV8S455_9BURK